MATGYKSGGRTKGTPNKTTEKAREMFNEVMADQLHKNRINVALDELYDESKTKYLYVFNKLAQYFLPKRMDITSDGEQLEGFKVEITKDADKDKTV